MRKKISGVLLVFLTAAFLLAADESKNPEGCGSLLPNGDFSEYDGSKSISHGGRASAVRFWTAYFFPDHGGKAFVEDNAYRGKRAVCLESTRPEKTLMWESEAVSAAPGQKFTLKFAFRIERLTAGKDWNKPGVMVVFYDAGGKRVAHRDLMRFGEDTPWKEFTSDFTVPAERKNIAKMRLGLVMSYCVGKVLFSNLELSAVPEKKTLGMKPARRSAGDLVFPEPKKVLPSGKATADLRFDDLAVSASDGVSGSFLKQMKKIFPSGKVPLLLEIKRQNPSGKKEYYELSVKPGKVMLSAETEEGLLCGIQTLIQLAKTNNGFLPEAEFRDWPDFDTRGLVMGGISPDGLKKMKLYKINLVWLCGGEFVGREWSRPLTGAEKNQLSALYRAGAEQRIRIVRGARPGFGPVAFHFSDPAHIEAVVNRFKDYYQCGGREFFLAFDDLFNIGRDRLLFEDDVKKFKNIANAHYFLADKVFKTLQALDRGNKLYIVPMYYFDPTFYSSIEKDYLKTLATLPGNVEFINTTTLTDEGIENAGKLTGRSPFLWSNYMSQFENITPRPEIIGELAMKHSPDLSRKLTGFMFVILPSHKMMLELFSDFMWNADSYNPEKSFARAMSGRPDAAGDSMKMEFARFEKEFASCPFTGLSKNEILSAAPDLFCRADSWEKSIAGLPESDRKELQTGLERHRENYKLLLKILKDSEYPVRLKRMSGDFSSMPVIAGKFLLPLKSRTRKDEALPAAVGTTVRGAYDDNCLYLRFICREPARDGKRNRVAERDGMVYTDDCVEAFIQPPGKKGYYHFAVNPRGVVYDAYKEDAEDKTYHSGIIVKTVDKPDEWIVDCSIPWKDITLFRPLGGQTLKVNFFRAKYSGKHEFSSAFPVVNGFHEKNRLWNLLLD